MQFSYILIILDGFLCYIIEYFIYVVQPESGIISPDLQVVIDHAIPRLRRLCSTNVDSSLHICLRVYNKAAANTQASETRHLVC